MVHLIFINQIQDVCCIDLIKITSIQKKSLKINHKENKPSKKQEIAYLKEQLY